MGAICEPPQHIDISFDWQDTACSFDVNDLLDELDPADKALLLEEAPNAGLEWTDSDAVRVALHVFQADDKYENIVEAIDDRLHGGIDWTRSFDCECTSFEWDCVKDFLTDTFDNLGKRHPGVTWFAIVGDDVRDHVSEIEHTRMVDLCAGYRGAWNRLHVTVDEATAEVTYGLDNTEVRLRPFLTQQQSAFAERLWDGDLDTPLTTASAAEVASTWSAARFDLAAQLHDVNMIVRVADEDEAHDTEFNDLRIDDIVVQLDILDALPDIDRQAVVALVTDWDGTLTELLETVKHATVAA